MIEYAKTGIREWPKQRFEVSSRVDGLIALSIAFTPVQWGTLLNVGGFSLELFHISALVLIVATVVRLRSYTGIGAMFGLNASWLGPIIVYLVLIAISLGYSRYSGGEASLARQIFFMTLGLLVAVRLAMLRDARRTLYVGGALSLIVYFLAVGVSAAHIGLSPFGAIANFLTTGDFNELTYRFFRPAFNAFQVGDVEFHASLRNNIASGLVVCFLCFSIGARSSSASPGKTLLDLFIGFLFLFSIGIILSRSVIASVALSLLVVYAVRVCAERKFTSVVLGSLAALALVVGIAVSDSPLAIAIYERFFVDTQSYQSRWKDYGVAIEVIERNILFGDGYYRIRPDGSFAAHNLFISAWAQAGLFAFIFSAWFWLAFMAMWGRLIVLSIFDRAFWQLDLPVDWVMALPMMGMFRLWSSGDGGNLNFSAWLSVGIFAGLVLLNESRRDAAKQTAEPTGAPEPERATVAGRTSVSVAVNSAEHH